MHTTKKQRCHEPNKVYRKYTETDNDESWMQTKRESKRVNNIKDVCIMATFEGLSFLIGEHIHVRTKLSSGPRHTLPIHLMYTEEALIVQQLSVKPCFRNKGYASATLKEIKNQAKNMKLGTLVQSIQNDTMRHICHKNGFRQIDAKVQIGGDYGFSTQNFPENWNLENAIRLTVPNEPKQFKNPLNMPNFDVKGEDFQDIQFWAVDLFHQTKKYRIKEMDEAFAIMKKHPSHNVYIHNPFINTDTCPSNWNIQDNNGRSLQNTIMESRFIKPGNYMVEQIYFISKTIWNLDSTAVIDQARLSPVIHRYLN